jgi:hypothetical protein
MIAAVMASASLAPPLVLIADNKPPTDDSSVFANEKMRTGLAVSPIRAIGPDLSNRTDHSG